jgi:hypothetical protein
MVTGIQGMFDEMFDEMYKANLAQWENVFELRGL